MEDAPVIDAEVVDEPDYAEPPPPTPASTEVVHRPQGSTALIVADSAREKREIAAEIATALDDVIKQQGLRTKMGSRKKVDANGNEQWVDSYHVNVEGWQTLATFLDLAVVPVWTRQVNDPTTGQPRRVTFPVTKTTRRDSGKTSITETYEVDGFDWEARVEVYKDGTLIAAAEAMVTRSEDSWKTRDDHALRSMAQTRATGKGIAGAARWIVALAGYSATPAEEMPPEAASSGEPTLPDWAQPASDELTKTAKNAVKYLTASDNGVAAGVWGGLLPSENAPMPRLVAQTIVKLATLVHRRQQTVPQEAAEQPVPDVVAKPGAAAGTIDSTPENIAQFCTCAPPVDGADEGIRDDACPIKTHGIPF